MNLATNPVRNSWAGQRIIFDVTRTLLRRRNATPSGIDRVEFAFLSRLLGSEPYSDVHFVVTTHVGCGIVPKPLVRTIFSELSSRWAPDFIPEEKSGYLSLRSYLETPIDFSRREAARFGLSRPDSWSAWQHVKLVPQALRRFWPLHLLSLEAKRIPTFYVHVSHVCLEHPIVLRWASHSAIRPVFFLHDIIPIEYPEFCSDSAVRVHSRRVETAASFAHTIIVNSHYTKDRIERFLVDSKLRRPPVVVSGLGTELLANANSRPIEPSVPYFLHIGTIEARKNIYHLLNVWRRILAKDGPDQTPRLVLAGRRGWKSQNVFDVLDGGRELAGHVVEASDLNDAELGVLMQGAAAVLAPSLVEGFGLPGAEALGRGVPVVASDIAAHREVLGEAAMLLDPTDGPGWADAIRALASSSHFRQNRIDAARRFKPVSWDAHVDLALAQATGNMTAGSTAPPPRLSELAV